MSLMWKTLVVMAFICLLSYFSPNPILSAIIGVGGSRVIISEMNREIEAKYQNPRR